MDRLLLSVLIGLAIAIIVVIPMLIKRLPRHTNIASFCHYIFSTIVIVNVDIPHLTWWLEGGVLGLALMIPTLIHVAQVDRKPLPIIITNALVFGTLAKIAAHYLLP